MKTTTCKHCGKEMAYDEDAYYHKIRCKQQEAYKRWQEAKAALDAERKALAIAGNSNKVYPCIDAMVHSDIWNLERTERRLYNAYIDAGNTGD